MTTEQDIIDATYIKKANQIKLNIKRGLQSLLIGSDQKGYVSLGHKADSLRQQYFGTYMTVYFITFNA